MLVKCPNLFENNNQVDTASCISHLKWFLTSERGKLVQYFIKNRIAWSYIQTEQ